MIDCNAYTRLPFHLDETLSYFRNLQNLHFDKTFLDKIVSSKGLLILNQNYYGPETYKGSKLTHEQDSYTVSEEINYYCTRVSEEKRHRRRRKKHFNSLKNRTNKHHMRKQGFLVKTKQMTPQGISGCTN